ncbi:MAG: Holliday junction branch migration DNA helicase RuvB [Planctomycetes bacterium]|nr:Holliday junction branch migration DNA helicase RuvB [Planctomycetota bacterium]
MNDAGLRSKDAEDLKLDTTLRPVCFTEFVGQRKIVDNLKLYIQAAKKRNEALDHVLLSGLPGLGKTTLACLITKELNSSLVSTSGPALEKPGDLAGLLSNLKKNDVLFIDEIHRIPTVVEEHLYSAIEDFHINIVLNEGMKARPLQIKLEPFTLIGATTREGLLSDAFRARFGVIEKLQIYPPEDLLEIIKRSAKILGVKIDEAGAVVIAERSRGTPRIANRFLRRIRDLAQVKSNNLISEETAKEGMARMGVDFAGLDNTDRKILQTIIRSGCVVGLKTIAISVGEEEDTIEEVFEPYLIQTGFMIKTPKGRKATELAYKHLNEKLPANYRKENGLWD